MSNIKCDVCPHLCNLREGQTGLCKARKNIDGKIISINYGKITSIGLDHIEKKPLSNFYSGSMILSVGSFGCNMDCPFCQNYSISTASEDTVITKSLLPLELANMANNMKDKGNIGVAFTYNEPMIGYEFVRDTAIEIKKLGMKNVVVTSGCVFPHVLEEVLPFIDAFNIDLKSFSKEQYKKLGGDLETVQNFIIAAAKKSHVEITNLIVPGLNDSEKEMEALSSWISSVGRNIPLHISRFFPNRNMTDCKPTDVELLKKLYNIAKEKLEHVFLGNV
ncbi:MAG: AmmeMemoRadiSam system radical SAM enzyme [Bacteroidales bacterium]|nr:AmmeMemoRadiSam system radical SAM enzyme [Bacteroidales bacterium]